MESNIEVTRINARIEGLDWHLGVLKSYKLTKDSCSPKYIKNCIEAEEKELVELKKKLAIEGGVKQTAAV